jgi:hypothetical protein
MSALFSWKGIEGADTYIVRINSPLQCPDENGKPVEWYCPTPTISQEGDRFLTLEATTLCNSTTHNCSTTLPMVDTMQYLGFSVQAVKKNNGQEIVSEQIHYGKTFTCNSSDLNNDGFVDIFDYSQLITNFNTNNCDYNLLGICPDPTNPAVGIFDYNKLVSSFRL